MLKFTAIERIPTHISILITAAALTIGCTREQETVDAEPAPVTETAPLRSPDWVPEPTRLRAWPHLNAWLKGADVDREPTMSPLETPGTVQFGAKLFALYCANCHGAEGGGDGPRSPVFDPSPRDLAAGVFKFRSTETGELPTPEDLFRTISGGLRGTGMLSFADLFEEERWALVLFVRTLSPAFAEDELADPIPMPPVPEDIGAVARVARGEAVYSLLKCDTCHGPRGHGDGEAAPTLKTADGKPLPAPNFATRPWKRGSDATSFYLTLMTGLDGSPMPSYADSVTADDLWDLVAFVQALDEASGVDPLDREEAARVIKGQYDQAVHTVVGGCGCGARK